MLVRQCAHCEYWVTNKRRHNPTIITSSIFPTGVWRPLDPLKRHWFAGPRSANTTVGASSKEMNRSMPISAPGWNGVLFANNFTTLAMAQMMETKHYVLRQLSKLLTCDITQNALV